MDIGNSLLIYKYLTFKAMYLTEILAYKFGKKQCNRREDLNAESLKYITIKKYYYLLLILCI